MTKFEHGNGIRQGLKDLRLNASNITSGITGMIFSVSGIVIIFSNVASEAGLSQQHVMSWLFTGFFIGGLSSIFFSLYYKMPIVLASSLPGIALVGALFKNFTLQQMAGGFIMSGIIILLIGISGIIDFIKRSLPIPIVMGMITGIFLSYALKMVIAVESQPLICGAILVSYFLTIRFFPKVPSQMIALIVSVVMIVLFSDFNTTDNEAVYRLAGPIFVSPEFTPEVFASISVPIALLAMTDCLKGYGVLRANNFNPPMNVLVTTSGVFSVLAGFSMSHAITFAGVGTAIVATDAAGEHSSRYAASVIKNIFSVCLAVLIGLIYPLLNSLPVAISNLLAGLAMLSLFTSSLQTAFGSKQFKLGSFFAMIVGISDITIAGISAPIWALIVGVIISLLVEREDFAALKQANESVKD